MRTFRESKPLHHVFLISFPSFLFWMLAKWRGTKTRTSSVYVQSVVYSNLLCRIWFKSFQDKFGGLNSRCLLWKEKGLKYEKEEVDSIVYAYFCLSPCQSWSCLCTSFLYCQIYLEVFMKYSHKLVLFGQKPETMP